MEQGELLRYVCASLEEMGVKHFVTGSQATIVFGEPRFTNDIDIVVALELAHLGEFLQRFPEDDYYVSREAARDAIVRRGMFNIIHPSSGLKVDVIIPDNTPFERQRFDRARRVTWAPGVTATFSSPEDVILKKLEFYKLGESDKHLRDITGVLKISGGSLDYAYIEKLAAQLGVSDIWQAVLDRVASQSSN